MAHQIKFFILLLLLLEYTCFAARFLHPANVQAVEGSQVDFICESDNREPIEECRFTVPAFHSKVIIFKGVINSKYEYVGEDFSKGQCGLRLLSIDRANAGKIICSLEVGDTRQEAQTDVTVLYPIDELNISSNNRYYEYKENELMEINCTAKGGFPASRLALYIGSQLVNSTSKQQTLIWKGPVQIENDGQKVECYAEQQNTSLSWTSTRNASRLLNVRFSPRIESGLNEVEVPVVLGQNVYVTVKILANPVSYYNELTKNGQEAACIVENKFNGSVEVYNWKISKVQLVDIQSDWRFIAANDCGNTKISIKLTLPIEKTTMTPIIRYSYKTNKTRVHFLPESHGHRFSPTGFIYSLVVICMVLLIITVLFTISQLMKQIKTWLLHEAYETNYEIQSTHLMSNESSPASTPLVIASSRSETNAEASHMSPVKFVMHD